MAFWKQFKNRNLFTFETNLFCHKKAFDDMLNTIWLDNIVPNDSEAEGIKIVKGDLGLTNGNGIDRHS